METIKSKLPKLGKKELNKMEMVIKFCFEHDSNVEDDILPQLEALISKTYTEDLNFLYAIRECIKSNNLNACINGMTIISLLVKDPAKMYRKTMEGIIPAVIGRLADEEKKIIDTAIKTLIRYMEAYTPEVLIVFFIFYFIIN